MACSNGMINIIDGARFATAMLTSVPIKLDSDCATYSWFGVTVVLYSDTVSKTNVYVMRFMELGEQEQTYIRERLQAIGREEPVDPSKFVELSPVSSLRAGFSSCGAVPVNEMESRLESLAERLVIRPFPDGHAYGARRELVEAEDLEEVREFTEYSEGVANSVLLAGERTCLPSKAFYLERRV